MSDELDRRLLLGTAGLAGIPAGKAAGPIVLTAGVATNTVTTANLSF